MLYKFYDIEALVFNNLAVKKLVSFVEVTNIRTHNKLGHIYIEGRYDEHLYQEMG